MKNVFIIGSKGIPANYGGFETFVEYLTKYKVSNDIKYHVACLSDHEEEFEHNQARCFKVQVPDIGPAKAVYYDIAALKAVYQYIVDHNIEEGIVYILACRIGPFLKKCFMLKIFKFLLILTVMNLKELNGIGLLGNIGNYLKD